MAFHPMKPETIEQAVIARIEAADIRRIADNVQTAEAGIYRAEADSLECAAALLLRPNSTPRAGTGAEYELSADDAFELPGLAEVIKQPDAVNLKASKERLELAAEAESMCLALDAADSIRPRNSLEMMLVHELAAAHRMSMRLFARAEREVNEPGIYQAPGQETVETTRLVNAAARLMTVYQDGLQTLHKIRSGGRQNILVQHVNVTDNAQAVVAAKVEKKGP